MTDEIETQTCRLEEGTRPRRRQKIGYYIAHVDQITPRAERIGVLCIRGEATYQFIPQNKESLL